MGVLFRVLGFVIGLLSCTMLLFFLSKGDMLLSFLARSWLCSRKLVKIASAVGVPHLETPECMAASQ